MDFYLRENRTLPPRKSRKLTEQADSEVNKNVKAKKILVVAFGNSLTAGYQSPTSGSPLPKMTPYTDHLKKIIDTALEKINKLKLLNVIFYNKGVSGELTGDMLQRLDSDVLSVKPSYATILGGSNDIGWSIEAEEIMDNLTQMYDKSTSAGIEVIACTVPSIIGPETLIKPRLKLNEMIKDYCFDNEIVCVDLFTSTITIGTNKLDKKYSSDGLHLNTAGYIKMAETIFEQAFSKLIPIWTVS
ncbi:SGNH/GDSL hydrolase family protein [[Eubacterium] cellulosolvens]